MMHLSTVKFSVYFVHEHNVKNIVFFAKIVIFFNMDIKSNGQNASYEGENDD